jgi:hypothetical protein
LIKAVGAEDASEGEFCETSNETVPVGKSSANETESDLPKLPEKLMGAPDANAAEKMPSARSMSAASAATHYDCVSLDIQLLIVFFIIR